MSQWLTDSGLDDSHLIIYTWMVCHQFTWLRYLSRLDAAVELDGLELLTTLVAMRVYITLVQRGQVWSSRTTGHGPADPILILVPDGVYFGASLQDKTESLPVRMGCPPTRDKGTMMSMDKNITRTDDQFDSDDSLSDLYEDTGVQSCAARTQETECPVCLLQAKSQVQLTQHLHIFHSEAKPYGCEDCDKCFNARVDKNAHFRMVHSMPQFCCLHCTFSAVLHFKIQKHIHTHSDNKYKCDHCITELSSKDALVEHLKHHMDTKVYPCASCEKQFSSALAYQIHFRGKHGDGYLCHKCGQRFDAPIQHCHHLKKCIS